jgi:hypothetical protein
MLPLPIERAVLWCWRRTPLAAGVAQNFVNLSLDLLLVVAAGIGVVSPLFGFFGLGFWELCIRLRHPQPLAF